MHAVEIRPAQQNDAEAAVPLSYSAGPEAFEYGFTGGARTARDFLAFAFNDGGGFFGWRNHVVAVLDGQVAGIGAFYSGHEYQRLSNRTVLQVLRFYPLRLAPRVIHRALQLKALMPAPPRTMEYVANLGVRPDLRSRGIGAALIRDRQAVAVQKGRRTYALDVSAKNPRAQALYERLGFAVTGAQRFPGATGRVPDTRRMELSIGA
jgi:ribosomal protein S18 acetylase RimI-like enzyme